MFRTLATVLFVTLIGILSVGAQDETTPIPVTTEVVQQAFVNQDGIQFTFNAELADTVPIASDRCAERITPDMLVAYAAYIDASREAYRIPGAAVAIVCDGEIVWTEGFGVKNLQTGGEINADTLFGLGSITKPMTAIMIATLVEDGYMDWDAPISTYLPDFVHDEMTLRMMLSHTTGMPGTDLPLFGISDPEAMMDFIGNIEPTSEPGAAYTYQNQVFATAAYAAVLAEDSQENNPTDTYRYLMQSRVFDPAGMTTATFRVENANRGNHATPYQHIITQDMVTTGGNLRPINYEPAGSEEPVGGVLASANDMGAFMLTMLNGGQGVTGERVVDAGTLAEMWQPVYDFTNLPPHMDTYSAALGWELLTFNGVDTVTHTGQAHGSTATMIIIPDDGIGIAVMANTNNSGDFVQGAQWHLVEMLYEMDSTLGAMYTEKHTAEQQMIAGVLAPMPMTVELDSVQSYLGTYELAGLNAEPYALVWENDGLYLRRGQAVDFPLISAGDSTYMVTTLFTGVPVTLSTVDGVPHMNLGGMLDLTKAIN
ncbi:MAG: serine hydrolase domain-containing protein [Aggregatilineales bacterium]